MVKARAAKKTKAANAKAKPAKAKPAKAKPAKAKPAKAKPKPAKAKPAKAKPKPARAKPARAKPKPARGKPAKGKPAKGKPARAKPGVVLPAKPRRPLKRPEAKRQVVRFEPRAQRSQSARPAERRLAPWNCAGRGPNRSGSAPVVCRPPLELEWSMDLRAAAAGAPVVSDDGVLFVGDREGGLHVVDVETGQRRFQLQTDPILEASPVWPLVEQGLVPADRVPVSGEAAILRWHLFFGDEEGIFYCVRRGDGEVLWRKAAPLSLASRTGGAYQAPVAVGDMVYTCDLDGNLYAAFARSGQTAFSRFLRGRPSAPPTLGLSGRRLVISTNPIYPGEQPLLHAFDAESGDRTWHVALPGRASSALASTGRHALVGTSTHLVSHALFDGTQVWRHEVDAPVQGGLALEGGLFFAVLGGSVAAFEIDSGRPVWRVETGDGILAPLVPGAGLTVCRGVLWVAAERSLLALHTESGKVLGRTRVPGKPVGGVVIAADRLLVATDTGELRAYRGLSAG